MYLNEPLIERRPSRERAGSIGVDSLGNWKEQKVRVHLITLPPLGKAYLDPIIHIKFSSGHVETRPAATVSELRPGTPSLRLVLIYFMPTRGKRTRM